MTSRKPSKPVIVLDVGGVLIDFDIKLVFATLSKRLGKRVRAPSARTLDKLFFPAQTGKISSNDILRALSSSLRVSIAPDKWYDILCSVFTGEVQGMRQVLLELKSDFFLVALTNTIKTHWTFLLRTYEIFKLIDAYIVSYTEGVAKPNPAIYKAVVDRYCDGRSPYFYTDDTPEYVDAARRMGWRSEVFISPLQFKNELLRTHGPK